MTKSLQVLRILSEIAYLFPDEEKVFNYVKKSLPGFAKLFKNDNDLKEMISSLGAGEDIRLIKKRFRLTDANLKELLQLQKMLK